MMQDRPGKNALDVPRWLHPSARVLLCDEDLLVVEKPAGVLSHPNPPQRSSPEALVAGVYDLRQECYRVRGETRDVFLVHRLDRETSGLILLAFDAEGARTLQRGLAERKVDKVYVAVLLGCPRTATGSWRDRLEKRSGSGRATVSVRPGEPNAITDYETQATFRRAGVTLVSLRPASGRTHQLRVQAAARSFPIVGDPLYGDFTANRYVARELGIKRMLLHATSVAFTHPRRGDRVEIRSDPGADWHAAVASLVALRVPVPRRDRTRRSAHPRDPRSPRKR